MSTCQSLWLEDAALLDSMDSGDISEMPSPNCGREKKRRKKIMLGQQNVVGGRSDKARLFTAFHGEFGCCERRTQTECGA